MQIGIQELNKETTKIATCNICNIQKQFTTSIKNFIISTGWILIGRNIGYKAICNECVKIIDIPIYSGKDIHKILGDDLLIEFGNTDLENPEMICIGIGGSLSSQDSKVSPHSCGLCIYIYNDYKYRNRINGTLCNALNNYIENKYPYLSLEFKYIDYAQAY